MADVKKEEIRRALRVVNKDGSEKVYEISSYAVIKGASGNRILLNLDKLESGDHRLIVGEGFVDDFANVDRIEVIREDLQGEKSPEE